MGRRQLCTCVYLQRQSLAFDIRILWLTFVKVLRRDGVSH
jgi:O-antigen biosynthesis protein WbqP